MQNIRKTKFKRDRKVTKLFNSRLTYLLILMFVIIYLFQEKDILNIPFYLTVALILISLGIIGLIFIIRYRKYRDYYRGELKKIHFIDVIILAAGIIMAVFVLQSFLLIPFNLIVKVKAQNNSIEYQNCEIRNVITTGRDKVHFTFLGRKYSRYVDLNGYTRRELIDHYYLELGVRKSILNTYYLESITVKNKNITIAN